MSRMNPSVAAGSSPVVPPQPFSMLQAIDAEIRNTLSMSLSILSRRREIACRLGTPTDAIDADMAAIRQRFATLGLEEDHD